MIAYATTTRTRRNVAALRQAGWRLLLTPDAQTMHAGLRYAIDNGAWGAAQRGMLWDAGRFEALVAARGGGADWIVLPDRVGDGRASLRLSARWVPRLSPVGPLLLPVQDGVTAADMRPFLAENIGIFVGGTTTWKLDTLPTWARLAREMGVWLHVARVNTARRIRACQMAGADSFDGTSATRYAVTLPLLEDQRAQHALWGKRG